MTTMVGTPWIRIKLMPELSSPIFRRPALQLRRSIRRHLCRSFSMAASADSPGPRKNDGEVRVRFAPSPTGNLHVGGARTALFNYLFARSKGGKFVLRIEDTDLERSTKVSEEAVLRDLSWLGLEWDEGPDVGGNYGPYRQSERNELYKQYADKLLESGYVYRCFCSNEELEKMKETAKLKGLPPVYTGKWATASDAEVQAELEKGTPFTYRFRVPKEGSLSIDDLIRGEALGFPMPYFAHVSLILAPDRSKLSKRHGATSVGQFREMGYLPPAMVNYLGLLGWSDGTENEFFTVDQLVEKFSIERVSKSGTIFDSVKLRWMNGHYLRSLPSEELTKAIGEHWKSAGILNESQGEFVEEAVALLKDGIDLVPDSDKALLNLLSYPLRDTLASPEAKPLLEDGLPEVAASLLAACDTGELIAVLEEGHAAWQKWVKGFGKALKRKGKALFMPLRVLLTGKLHGPDMGASIVLLHKAGRTGIVNPQVGFVTLDERFKVLRELDWASLTSGLPSIESAATAVH